MPGMMDTILNLGLNDVAVEGLAAATGNPRFAYDSYRRLIQMYGEVVDGIDGHVFEGELQALKEQPRGEARRRADGRRPAGPDRDVRGALRARGRLPVPHGRPRAAPPRDARGVRLLGVAARQGLPAHVRHPGRPRHRRQRRPDGLREQGRHLGHRASASPATRRRASGASTASSSSTRRARTSSPGIRTPEPIERMRELLPDAYTELDEHARAARGALPRDAGHRVHGRGGTALPAPDAGPGSGPRRPRCGSPSR